MSEIIQFVPKSERERTRLIREARAIYDSIFPATGPAGERHDETVSPQNEAIPLAWRNIVP
jgi:hypothetical protein